jgi:hypothetical protein
MQAVTSIPNIPGLLPWRELRFEIASEMSDATDSLNESLGGEEHDWFLMKK